MIGIIFLVCGASILTIVLYKNKKDLSLDGNQNFRSNNVQKHQFVTALGRLQPKMGIVEISGSNSLATDRLAQLLVKRGDYVRINQIVAILDSQDRLQTIFEEAKKRTKVAQAKLNKVKAGAKKETINVKENEISSIKSDWSKKAQIQKIRSIRLRAQLDNAQIEFERNQKLYDEGAITASELDRKKLALKTAVENFNESEASLKRIEENFMSQLQTAQSERDEIVAVDPLDIQVATSELALAKASLERAKVELNEATVRTPIAGKVSEIYTQPGEKIDAQGIMHLIQDESIEVKAEVYQSDIYKIKIGQEATITSEAFKGKLKGFVYLIGMEVNQQRVFNDQLGENLDRRVIDVRISLEKDNAINVSNLTNLQVQVKIKTNYPR
jgi:HlyD family secretion protein